MAQKLIYNYNNKYKICEIGDTIYFYKMKPNGSWQLDKVLDVSLNDLFECGKIGSLIVIMRFYKDLFLGSINGVGTDVGYMCPKTKEMSLERTKDSDLEVLFDNQKVYYDKNGKIIDLNKYL